MMMANNPESLPTMGAKMAELRGFSEGSGSPSSFPTDEDFRGLADGKPADLTDGILRGPGADGKPNYCPSWWEREGLSEPCPNWRERTRRCNCKSCRARRKTAITRSAPGRVV